MLVNKTKQCTLVEFARKNSLVPWGYACCVAKQLAVVTAKIKAKTRLGTRSFLQRVEI